MADGGVGEAALVAELTAESAAAAEGAAAATTAAETAAAADAAAASTAAATTAEAGAAGTAGMGAGYGAGAGAGYGAEMGAGAELGAGYAPTEYGMSYAYPEVPYMEPFTPPAEPPAPGIDSINPNQMADVMQQQISQAGQTPLQPSPYEPTASNTPTSDVGEKLVEKPPVSETPAGPQEAYGETGGKMGEGTDKLTKEGADSKDWKEVKDFFKEYRTPITMAALGVGIPALVRSSNNRYASPSSGSYSGPLSQFKYSPSTFRPSVAPGYADGGIASAPRQTGLFPQSQMDRTQFATPSQMPISREIIGADYDATISPYTGDLPSFARGGDLGGYSDGGRMLKGPGDGMSDSIPATIAGKQEARLADGEFVVPADVVSHLGNGSTDAGAKQLYAMMDKVRKARTGTKKQGKQINAHKYMPKFAQGGGIASFASGNLVVNPETNEVGYWNQNGDNYWDREWVPISTSQNPTGVGATSATQFSPTTYDANYYNQPYWESQLKSQQDAIAAAQKKLAAAQSRLPTSDLSNLSETAKQNAQANAWYQQYLGRNIGQDEPFSNSLEGILRSQEYAQRKPYMDEISAAQQELTSAQSALEPIQANVSRLKGTETKYDPYTVANRPSGNEPQFYGNIYRGQAPDYSAPGYTLSGGNLGEWNNVAGETARAGQPASKNQQVTQAYLQGLGRAPDTAGFNYWMQNNAPVPDIVKGIQTSEEARNNPLAVAQYYQDLLGRAPDAEGLKFWQTAANAGTNPDLIKQQMMTSPEYQVRQMYEQNLGRAADQAGQQFWTNAITQQGFTPEQVSTAIKNTDEGKAYAAKQAEPEKKRTGGIASLVRR